LKEKFMSNPEVIRASRRTELQSAQSANSQPKPNDAFVDSEKVLVNFGYGSDADGGEKGVK